MKARPMAGSAAWLSTASVSRIAFVGVDPKFGDTRQDIFEAPRTVLDFQVGKNLGKFNLKFTLAICSNKT